MVNGVKLNVAVFSYRGKVAARVEIQIWCKRFMRLNWSTSVKVAHSYWLLCLSSQSEKVLLLRLYLTDSWEPRGELQVTTVYLQLQFVLAVIMNVPDKCSS